MKVLLGETADSRVPAVASLDKSVISVGEIGQIVTYSVSYQGGRYTFTYPTDREGDHGESVTSFKDKSGKQISVWIVPGETGNLQLVCPGVPLRPRIQITGPYMDLVGKPSRTSLGFQLFTGQGQPPWPMNMELWRNHSIGDIVDRILRQFRSERQDGGFVANGFCAAEQVPQRDALIEAFRVALEAYDPTFPVKWP